MKRRIVELLILLALATLSGKAVQGAKWVWQPDPPSVMDGVR